MTALDNAARACASFYGIISPDDFTCEFNALYGTDFNNADLANLLFQLAMSDQHEYGFATNDEDDDRLYLCDESLTMRANGLKPEDEETEGLIAYRGHILERHREVGRRPFAEVVGVSSAFDYALGLESAHRLETRLNAHVPDGADDHRYADASWSISSSRRRGRSTPMRCRSCSTTSRERCPKTWICQTTCPPWRCAM